MGFSQALSGVGAASQQLDVVGNNIANSQTSGFKSSSVQFADVFANSQVGLGTRVSGVLQDFSNGNLESTGRNLDLAITGSGFFRFEQDGQVGYSRNGQLTMTADGYLVNSQGARVMGYGLSDANDPFSGVAPGGQPKALKVPANDMPASATSRVTSVYNMDAGASAADADKNKVSLQAVDANGDLVKVDSSGAYDSTGSPLNIDLKYNYSNSYTAYDSLGNTRNVTNYFEKVGDNQWKVTTAVDGKLAFTGTGAGVDNSYLQNSSWVKFDGNGQLAQYSELNDPTTPTPDNPNKRADGEVVGIVKAGFQLSLASSSVSESNGNAAAGYYDLNNAYSDANVENPGVASSAAEVSFPVDGGANQPLSFAMDLSGTTQFANDSTQNTLTQNGYTSGSLIGISIADDGTVMRNYSNEKSVAAGQITLANFRNPEGLKASGDNMWAATESSGAEVLGTAGVGQFGSIAPETLEQSNVDLTQELVNLIIAQRNYQANTNSIRTQSEVMDQIAQLR
ncbi:flagellar hook protein FlgE [Modicisalibacter tunisiensis]|uniref:flagellar hook protein FlgE n=1 Tax=Modicisalibacter tunisiensis TaxID=390637 RepID=UPI001CC9E2BB|nr:flagellar hook protein FlgE [Modicisalibacter tunisiensis]MBZ9538324.1 flagellar hook protein FlgE [Modicisalibacter tunisiensis]